MASWPSLPQTFTEPCLFRARACAWDVWWVEGRGSVLAVRAIQAQGLMGGFLEESVLERELVRQAGEEENSGDSWLDQKPRGPRHLLCLTHKETESQREGLVGLC